MNTASIAGLVVGADIASYAVTKFGVVALSEHLYLELEGAGAKTKVSVLCPGFVATKIMDSERNRPADRQDASPMPTDPQSEIYYEWFRGQVEKGLASRTVGDQVLSAIREERFYILDPSLFTAERRYDLLRKALDEIGVASLDHDIADAGLLPLPLQAVADLRARSRQE